MKRLSIIILTLAAIFSANAQTLNVNLGDVTYAFPAEITGDMPYTNGSTLTVNGKAFDLSAVTNVTIDNEAVTDNAVDILYNGTRAKVRIAGNIAQYVSATVTNGHVAILQSDDFKGNDAGEITYNLSGSSNNGSFWMDGSYKCTVAFNGLTLTCPDSATVNIRDGKRISVVVADGTTNTLTDAANGSHKATLMVNGHTELKGSGTLTLKGLNKHAFWGDEYVEIKKSFGTLNITSAVADGMNINQYLEMKGGTVSISGVGDDGIDVSATDDSTDEMNGEVIISGGTLTVKTTAAATKGIKSESLMTISGGTVNVTTSGTGTYDSTEKDASGCACLKSKADISITGGTLNLTSTGNGGKGIKAKNTFTMDDGTLTINTSGSTYSYGSGWTSYKSQPKGIKSDGNLTINGGKISVKTTGHEGIESKSVLTINDGQVEVTSKDDGINAASHLWIKGGKVYAYSSDNDGIDANGNLYIQGGTVVAVGTKTPECGLDANEEGGYHLYISGGTVIGFGSNTSYPKTSTEYNNQETVYFSNSSATTIGVYDSTGNLLYAWDKNAHTTAATVSSSTTKTEPGGRPGGSGSLFIISAPGATSVKTGVSISGGTSFHGLTTDATVTGGSTVTVSNAYNASSGGGGGWW